MKNGVNKYMDKTDKIVWACVIVLLAFFISAALGVFNKSHAKEIPSTASTFVVSSGCFWCTEKDFEKLDGVYDAVSGFTAGTTPDPKYYKGKWGDHREGVKVYYDSNKISFSDLVKHAYATMDWQDDGGQFCFLNDSCRISPTRLLSF